MANADKRTVSTDALETLGTIIDETQKRDAIHLAVIPMIAAVKLYPGMDVAVDGDKATTVGELVGIVDPFLKSPVQPDQRFWLVIYPRKITSLRHVWSHPAFDEEKNPGPMIDSEIWLRAYAMRMNSYDTPEKAYERLLDCLRTGEMFAHGSDLHGAYELDDADNLKMHGEKVLGIKIDFKTFSCSC